MKTWRKIFSVREQRTEPPQTEGCAQTGTDPIFACDAAKQRSVFRLNSGKWAGLVWVARLKCCENPLCDCANVDFYCATDDGSERPAVVHFALDPMKRAIAPNEVKDRHADSAALAKAVTAEFGEEEWRCLRQYLLTQKRKAIRDMDVTKIPAPSSPSVITDDGSMARFADLFPFAEGFEFDLAGKHWVADDQYCVMPDCECREVALSFLPLETPSDGSNKIPSDRIPVARYDYKDNRIVPIQAPAADQPSLQALADAARAQNPTLIRDVKRRHAQLKTLYARALLQAPEGATPHGGTAVRVEPKVGRNDPCPCGSGKKYKKCCGRAA
jgi:hypothetical protein